LIFPGTPIVLIRNAQVTAEVAGKYLHIDI